MVGLAGEVHREPWSPISSRVHRPVAASLVKAECSARTALTLAADHAANLKGLGLFTARRDAIHGYYSMVPGTPPPEDNGFLWG